MCMCVGFCMDSMLKGIRFAWLCCCVSGLIVNDIILGDVCAKRV